MVSCSTQAMKGEVRYRLSPNEAARVVQEEKERRRKLRIVQVREMAKSKAAKIRQAVRQEEQTQMEKLSQQAQLEWEAEKEEQVRRLREQYETSLHQVGESHAQAREQERHAGDRVLAAIEDNRKAEQRHQVALRKLHEDRNRQAAEENRHIAARQIALQMERARAAYITSLPPPPSDPLKNLMRPRVNPVKMTDRNAFSSTEYNIAHDVAVERATSQEKDLFDARRAARDEQKRYDDANAEIQRLVNERREKARLRQKRALQKELLKQDYKKMLRDLSDLRRDDVHRRQQNVARIPRQIFVPPHRRLEEDHEEQVQMERAFEDLYLAATDQQGDLTLALDGKQQQQHQLSHRTESLDLSTTDEATSTSQDSASQESQTIPMQIYLPRGLRQTVPVDGVGGDVSSVSEQDRGAVGGVTQGNAQQGSAVGGLRGKDWIDSTKPPDSGLKRLLDRIRHQRESVLAKHSGTMTPPSNQTGQQPIRIPSAWSSSDSTTVTSEQTETTPSGLSQHTITSSTETSDRIRTRLDSDPAWFAPDQDVIGPSSGSPARHPDSPASGRILPGRTTNAEAPASSPGRPQGGPGDRSLETGEQSRSAREPGPPATRSPGKDGAAPRDSTTLLYPMERAANIRHQSIQVEGGNEFLADERARQERIRARHLQIKQEAEQYMEQIEQQRSDLERKYAEIEARKAAYKQELSQYTLPDSETNEELSQHTLPSDTTRSPLDATAPVESESRNGRWQGSRTSYDLSQHTILSDTSRSQNSEASPQDTAHVNLRLLSSLVNQPDQVSHPRVGTANQFDSRLPNFGPSNVSTRSLQSSTTPRDQEHIRRIKEYQNKLLLRESDIERVVEDLQDGAFPASVESRTTRDSMRIRTEGDGQHSSPLVPAVQPPTQQHQPPAILETNQKSSASQNEVLDTYSSHASAVLPDEYLRPPQVSEAQNTAATGALGGSGFHNWTSFNEPTGASDSFPVEAATSGAVVAMGPSSDVASVPTSVFEGSGPDTFPGDTQIKGQTGYLSSDLGGIRAHTRQLLHEARGNILSAEENLYSTLQRVAGTGGPRGELSDLYTEYQQAAEGFGLRFSDSVPSADARTETDADLASWLNNFYIGASREGQRSRPQPAYVTSRVDDGHVAHELSTIVELDEQSARKQSQLASASRKRLSSSPIKESPEDKERTQTRRHLEFDVSTQDDSEVIAGSLSLAGGQDASEVSDTRQEQLSDAEDASAALSRDFTSALAQAVEMHGGEIQSIAATAAQAGGVRDSLDSEAFHPTHSGIVFDRSDLSNVSKDSEKRAQSSSGKTWADVLSADVTPAPDVQVPSSEQFVWIEYHSASGGKKLERISVSDFQRLSAIPSLQETLMTSVVIKSSSPPQSKTDTVSRISDISGVDDLSASVSSRPKSSTPTSSSKTTVKTVTNLSQIHSPIAPDRPTTEDSHSASLGRDFSQSLLDTHISNQSLDLTRLASAIPQSSKNSGLVLHSRTDDFHPLTAHSSSDSSGSPPDGVAGDVELSQHTIRDSTAVTNDLSQLSHIVKEALDQDLLSVSQMAEPSQRPGELNQSLALSPSSRLTRHSADAASLSQHTLSHMSSNASLPFPGQEKGILEESDLTLLSLSFASGRGASSSAAATPRRRAAESPPEQPRNSSQSGASAPGHISVTSFASPSREQHSQSLLSFERHENSLLTSTESSLLQSAKKEKFAVCALPIGSNGGTLEGTRVHFDDQEQIRQESDADVKSIDVLHVQDAADVTSGPSNLQEAFELRKQRFIRNSEKRKQQAKQRAVEKAQKQQEHHVSTLQSWKKSRSLNARGARGPSNKENVHKGSDERQKEEREMKKRTERLYSQLEEVKQQKQIKERQEQYAENRQRKKEYQQKHQERLKKKSKK